MLDKCLVFFLNIFCRQAFMPDKEFKIHISKNVLQRNLETLHTIIKKAIKKFQDFFQMHFQDINFIF